MSNLPRQRSHHKRSVLSAREVVQLLIGSVLLVSYRGARNDTTNTSRLTRLLPSDDPTYSSRTVSKQSNGNLSSIDVDSICLVHVGKTAGSYVSCRLGLRYAPECNESTVPDSSILAEKTNHYLHLYENSCHRTNSSAFLVTVRNPISRILSWWNYEKPKRAKGGPRMKRKRLLWLDCYSNVEDMAGQGLYPLTSNGTDLPTAVDQMSCQQRAWAAVLGERKFGDHNYYNYAFYKKELSLLQSQSTSSKILVLRSEHLEQDWNHLERLMSKNTTAPSSTANVRPLNQGKHKYVKLTKIQANRQAMGNLCAALCEEIQVYKYFLKKAVNLSPQEVTKSLKELQQSCPGEYLAERRCEFTPVFPREKSVKRTYPK